MKIWNPITRGAVLLLFFAAWGMAAPAAPSPSSKPATEPASKVVATVNGELIYESELLAAMPDDAFQGQLEDLKKFKLKRLVEASVQTQFLKDHKVVISEDELKKGIKDFEQMVKTPGCPCCGGGYESLEQFMKVNAFTMTEIRRRVTCDTGLKLYADRLAKEQTSPQALAETVKKRRAQIEAECVVAYTISFDYTRDPDYFRDEKAVQAKKEKLANDAWARLKKGESFEKVAKEASEDTVSGAKGGALGCIHADYMGPEVQQVFRKLEPGKYSPVIKAAWGCCIVMRKNLTEEDILTVVKEQAKNLAEDQMYQELDAWRKRAKIQYGP
jgi:parvulin-like peptidyl-prolyl isomerase